MEEKKNLFRPKILDAKIPEEKIALDDLLNHNPPIEIIDEIEDQVKELVKLRHPAKTYGQEELEREVDNILKKEDKNQYGVWVYYSWLNKVIHLLNKEEFIEVRTNRNRNKITREEQSLLATKRIGIVGLSVGNSIAKTIVQERICSEVFLADFDAIELSNLNRIQTGIQNLGLKKTLVVAREIAEIDPFIHVTCFADGITEENIDEFFAQERKLDICVEVCDDLNMKVLLREKAKSLQIPVVMDTNDRGMIDIERFDLEPSRDIFHGLINHLTVEQLRAAKTLSDKLPFVDAIINFNNTSTRFKNSMGEIGKTLVSWPQLASSVNLGGAVTCDVCRRILLGELNISGRFYIDLSKLIA